MQHFNRNVNNTIVARFLSEIMLHTKMCNVRTYVTHEYENLCNHNTKIKYARTYIIHEYEMYSVRTYVEHEYMMSCFQLYIKYESV